MDARRLSSQPSDRAAGIICDPIIVLAGDRRIARDRERLRRIRYKKNAAKGKTLVFITNHRKLPAATVCALYKSRWQVELFFKWIKQHRRIKTLYGASENAERTQIWIAVGVYVLVAIARKRLGLDASLHTLIQILSRALFEKMPILQALSQPEQQIEQDRLDNQLKRLIN